ncbi:LysR family transcriptional regulator [Paramagnetospirillum caucaseum]|uniref:LysR family transcriptional regulator n=1 Tax=Paramagnetospirillum caucaseum TaxID=1244869 RepID=M3AA37_9PROT|nr:LysR family transcriptional regulator [Paramagnetospirillum caucaseum]EME69603.1 LysR family transcriptional regulator [Paramagnetospirillum caucaseum]
MGSAGMDIIDPEQGLSHLRAFLSVAMTGSIAKSSDDILKASSAITRSIRELEGALGVALFERRPRGMLINAYGNAVLLRAVRIHDQAEQVADELCRSKSLGAISRNVVFNLMFSGRKLQLLEQLSELRHLSAAAAKLGVSQAGASMSLSRIESSVGQPLFHRMLQGMMATDTADKLVAAGKRVFAELRHMEADISAIAGTQQGTVIIGALPLGRTYILPTAIAHALKSLPNIRVKMVEAPYDVLVSGLRTGDIDLIFGALRPEVLCRGLITEPLFSDRIGILARTGHPLAGLSGIPLGDLLNEQWILPRSDAPGRRLIDDSFAELGLSLPKASVESGDLAIVRQLLRSSDMLTAMSPRQMRVEIESGMLVELPVALGQTTRRIGLTLRDGARLPPIAHSILDSIRLHARDHSGKTGAPGHG